MKHKFLYLLQNPLRVFTILITRLPYFGFIRQTAGYQGKVNFNFWFKQKVVNAGGNRKAYWPVHSASTVYDAENILVGVDAYPGIMQGCYIQGRGGIVIGNYTQVGPDVVIISANHDVYDSRRHLAERVEIGEYCWLGAGAKIMPGVTLGDWTIVGAGAVVTKSFPKGYCILGGVPAKEIRILDPEKCVRFSYPVSYNGYIRSDRFPDFRKRKLTI